MNTGPSVRPPPRAFFDALRHLARIRAPTWPDDCPDCGSRMEFVFAPQAIRQCARCGLGIISDPLTGKLIHQTKNQNQT